MIEKIEKLQIILKIAERCNLTCSYCYYLFAGHDDHLSRPPLIGADVAQDLCSYLKEAIEDYNVDRVEIVFHGGEPMLLPKRRFSELCGLLREELEEFCNLSLCIQTNGTLIDEEWIEIFDQFGVAVGLSIDGFEKEHDTYRVDVHGRGSFQKIIENLNLIRTMAPRSIYSGMGIINVINKEMNYGKFIDFIHNELGIRRVSFLLPDGDHDSSRWSNADLEQFGKILCELLDYHFEHDDVEIDCVEKLLARITQPRRSRKSMSVSNFIVVGYSNGDVSIDDTLMPATGWYKSIPKQSSKLNQLRELVESAAVLELEQASQRTPEGCEGCNWISICGGGDIENRYSSIRGFDNPSIYCSSLKMFYHRLAQHLHTNGYPLEKLQERFGYREAA